MPKIAMFLQCIVGIRKYTSIVSGSKINRKYRLENSTEVTSHTLTELTIFAYIFKYIRNCDYFQLYFPVYGKRALPTGSALSKHILIYSATPEIALE